MSPSQMIGVGNEKSPGVEAGIFIRAKHISDVIWSARSVRSSSTLPTAAFRCRQAGIGSVQASASFSLHMKEELTYTKKTGD